MHRLLLLILWFPLSILLWSRGSAQQSTPASLEIRSPLPGQALQGRVPIYARILVSDYQSAELSFSYSADRTNTWFLIAEFDRALPGEKLLEWDTTTLTDGNYTLRLVVTQQNESQVAVLVPQLRIRNYSPIETSTHTPSPTPAPGSTHTPTPFLTPTLTPVPFTATPLPTNPAQLSLQDISSNLGQGVLGVFAFFLLLGAYAILRKGRRS
jgi:hypothetical protein